MTMTLGEYRVGVDFNPSQDDVVGYLKYKAARFIDAIDEIDAHGNPEIYRLKAHAMTLVEDAAMNAVKAQTKKPREYE
jgi:hypothetical protein